ncbi:sugar ABC transporter ATP-binding protein [Mesorhizobium sp. M7A.F.Ca.US.006.01.1.1]|uniref:sugar ABC transporter ATP-binding protein n=1 Tax=Mesorhizobium sp. M7A.F.Ca.US.006.01.1.1 TaxID=2496707 RepID=UPI000FCC193C|nr:sugar ABC transporter ATP-binding protein [Mesorhizobium sp. M7A.F.Ca.US.006.01.1.1]RUZ74407.1 sugar ABC transporter ATP-binding protein [Mesorhizobium sp. M7A.F.Ca.US.006.01.1.1]
MATTTIQRAAPAHMATSNQAKELLRLENIEVRFGATKAVRGVTLGLAAGEIIGLMGANGAGKSTLAKVIVGEIPHGAFSGAMGCMGSPAAFLNARDAHKAGITLVHQEGSVVPQLSVGENVMLTIEPSRFGHVNWPKLHAVAEDALNKVGARIDSRAPLGAHGGIAMMELIEIARAIARGSQIFVFDESTSALGADEIAILFQRMRELADQGAGVIFISHRIDEILQVCSRVVVLRDGEIALDAPHRDVQSDLIVRAMLGERPLPAGAALAGSKPEPGQQVLRLRNWCADRSSDTDIAIGPFDLELAERDIVAIYGPLGSGKTELLRSLFGLSQVTVSGEMHLGGKLFVPSEPAHSIRMGIAYVSAERQRDGLVPQLSVLENMMLGWHGGCPRLAGRIVDHRTSEELCGSFIRDLAIRTSGPAQSISALSGGNQQKVLLARALINNPRLLLLDEPTRGIDLGARQDVYSLIRKVVRSGTAVIYATLEESEALEHADRILVVRNGRPVALLRANETDQHQLLSLAGGL